MSCGVGYLWLSGKSHLWWIKQSNHLQCHCPPPKKKLPSQAKLQLYFFPSSNLSVWSFASACVTWSLSAKQLSKMGMFRTCTYQLMWSTIGIWSSLNSRFLWFHISCRQKISLTTLSLWRFLFFSFGKLYQHPKRRKSSTIQGLFRLGDLPIQASLKQGLTDWWHHLTDVFEQNLSLHHILIKKEVANII